MQIQRTDTGYFHTFEFFSDDGVHTAYTRGTKFFTALPGIGDTILSGMGGQEVAFSTGDIRTDSWTIYKIEAPPDTTPSVSSTKKPPATIGGAAPAGAMLGGISTWGNF